MKKNEKWFFVFPLLVMFALFSGCNDEESGKQKEDIRLKTPLKSYSHNNPIMTQAFGADPYAIVYNDRVYVYMTGDTLRYGADNTIQQNNYNNIRTIRVLSSADLVNWAEHPEIRAAGSSGAAAWANQSWAPAAAYKEINGQMKFFLYFADNANGIGVLAADSPTGPFTDPIGKALISRSTPNCGTADVVWLFDPAVLVDDDGTGYIYFGGGTPDNGGSPAQFASMHPMPGTIRAARLGSNMTSLAANPVRLDVPFSFEDAGINKIGNTYYYSYCTNPQVETYAAKPDQFPEAAAIGKSMSIAYMTSDKPLQDFVLRGMILPNPGGMFGIKGGNNHHCLFEFRGRWYIAYHSRLLADAMGLDIEGRLSANGEGYRSTNIDEVTVNADGTIALINGTRTGVSQNGTFNPYQPVNAAVFAVMAGITTVEYQPEAGAPLQMKAADITPGSWTALKGVDFGAGAKQFSCRVNPPKSGKGVIQLRLDSLNGPEIGSVAIKPGQQSAIVDLPHTVTGIHDLIFVFYGSGYDFEQWEFFPE